MKTQGGQVGMEESKEGTVWVVFICFSFWKRKFLLAEKVNNTLHFFPVAVLIMVDEIRKPIFFLKLP